METEMTLNEMERRLIELVRALPEAQVQQVIALAAQLKNHSEKKISEVREMPEGYAANLDVNSLPRGVRPEVMEIVQRSLDEHADVWAELAKR